MISVIFDNEKRMAYVNVHMEQVYSDIKNEKKKIDVYSNNRLKRKNNKYFGIERVYDGNIFIDLKKYKNNKEYEDYSWVFDLKNIKVISQNAIVSIVDSLGDSVTKIYCNAEQISEESEQYLMRKGFVKKQNLEDCYISVYKEAIIRFLTTNSGCRFEKVLNETGEQITNYINLKPFLEEQQFMFSSCYLLAENIKEILAEPESYAFFCHTLNGAAIASTISNIFGVDVVYADNLNVSGMIRKKYMPEYFTSGKKSIIVTDMVCQGHEIIRAKDIIEMLGGECEGNICLIDVEIAGKNRDRYQRSLLHLDADLKKRFGYEITIGEK